MLLATLQAVQHVPMVRRMSSVRVALTMKRTRKELRSIPRQMPQAFSALHAFEARTDRQASAQVVPSHVKRSFFKTVVQAGFVGEGLDAAPP